LVLQREGLSAPYNSLSHHSLSLIFVKGSKDKVPVLQVAMRLGRNVKRVFFEKNPPAGGKGREKSI
jgi:hypothetical protein